MNQMQPLQRGNIRLAATVMLVRDSEAGLQVYMVKRPGSGDFPDLHVFPGGKVDEDDWAPELCFDLEDEQASERLGIARGGLRYWVAVARECFEECGVLLAHRNGEMPDFGQADVRAAYSEYRRRLLADEISFADICQAEQLQVACDLLAYFSHWLTPEVAPRRFDTRFFIAAMPPGQTALADTDETTGEHWEYPGQALGRHESGEWRMIDPTLRSLETLSGFSSVAQALAGVNQADHLMPLTDALRAQGMQPLR